MMTSLGHCCWFGRRFSQSPNCWSSCNISGKMSECEEDRNKGMVSDVERGRSLCGRETLSSMRDRMCLCGSDGGGSCVDGSGWGSGVRCSMGVVVLVTVVRVLREL